MTIQATTKKLLKKTKKLRKNRKKTITFFNSETDPDPDRLPKVNPAGL
jgi:hypothetical protein